MVVMDEQALEAQSFAALGGRRKMLKMFEVRVIRREMGIDDLTAPPPPSGGQSRRSETPTGSAEHSLSPHDNRIRNHLSPLSLL